MIRLIFVALVMSAMAAAVVAIPTGPGPQRAQDGPKARFTPTGETYTVEAAASASGDFTLSIAPQ